MRWIWGLTVAGMGCGQRVPCDTCPPGQAARIGTGPLSDTDTGNDGTAVDTASDEPTPPATVGGVVYSRNGCPGIGDADGPRIPWPNVVQLLVCDGASCAVAPERLIWYPDGSAVRVYLVGCSDADTFRLSWVSDP